MSPSAKKSVSKTYLVTGGAGFIGSHLVDRLLAGSHRVVVIDDLSNGALKNLAQHKKNKNFTFYKKDICSNLTALFKKEKFVGIFHLAALARVPFSIAHPRESHEANVSGTLNLLLAARDAGVKRFVFASSGSVYGDQQIPLVETMTCKPISPYGLQKFIGEEYCRLFTLLYGMETIGLRYFNVYGPRQNPEGAYANQISKFMKSYAVGEQPTIFGDGSVTRDNTFVSDVVDATVLASRTSNKEAFGSVFNIGAGKNISVKATTQYILNLAGSTMWPQHGPARIEPHDALADNSKARKILAWIPKTLYTDGLKITWEWFSNNYRK